MDTRSAFVSLQVLKFLPLITAETRFTDTRLIRTPRYYEQFSFSLVLIFFPNSTRLIWTPRQ